MRVALLRTLVVGSSAFMLLVLDRDKLLHPLDDQLYFRWGVAGRCQGNQPDAVVVDDFDGGPFLEHFQTVPHGVGRYAFTCGEREVRIIG